MTTREYLKSIHASLIHRQRDHPAPRVARLITAVEMELQLIPMDDSEAFAEWIIEILISRKAISPLQEEWAKEYLIRSSEAFWEYIKLSCQEKEKRHEKIYPCFDSGFGPGRY